MDDRRVSRLAEPPGRRGDTEPHLTIGPFRLTAVGIVLNRRAAANLEDWQGPLQFVLWAQKAVPWWIGDLLNAGEAEFGERVSQICAEHGVSTDMVQRYKGVAARVPINVRRPTLSWSAHAMVARLPLADQQRWLLAAEKNGWSSEELRRQVRDAKAAKEQR